jgi:hypothetical protein
VKIIDTKLAGLRQEEKITARDKSPALILLFSVVGNENFHKKTKQF